MIRNAFHRKDALRRIRWSLQPRSHDHCTAFDDVMIAGWHSRTTLGASPILTRLAGESDSRLYLSPDAPADGFTRRPSLRARPPFTRP